MSEESDLTRDDEITPSPSPVVETVGENFLHDC